MSRIHPTAIVEDGAQLSPGVEVGPYAIIGANVKIGPNTKVQAHAHVRGYTTIGRECEIFPYSCIGFKTQDLKYQEGDITYVEIGDHSVFREFSTVHSGTKPGEVTRVGSHSLIMAYCHVAHGCEVGNHVIMSNLATLAGEVLVGDYAIIGGLVGVHQFCRIGSYAMVGGGAHVRQDCPPYMLIESTSNGARVLGPNVVGLQRRGVTPETRSAIKDVFRLIYREGLNRTQALERARYDVPDLPEVQEIITFYTESKRGVI